MSDLCAIAVTADGHLRLSGELTFESVPHLWREVERRQSDFGSTQVIDLSGITAADSAGLALLLEWQASRRRRGADLSIRQAPGGLLRLAGLCEAVELLQISGRGAEA